MTGFSRGNTRHYDIASKISDVKARQRLAVVGEICSAAATRHDGSIALRVEIDDGTGRLGLLIFGRAIPGLVTGACLRVWGTAIPDGSGFVALNPRFEFAAPPGPMASPVEPSLDERRPGPSTSLTRRIGAHE